MAPATKGGMHFQRPQGGCMVFPRAKARLYGFSRQRRHKKWRPWGRRTSPAQRCYIPPEGESPQPACKAKPITGRTLAAQGRKARRRHQPSPAKAGVNLREYWKAPPRSRSRPRHRRLNPQAPKGLVQKALTSSLKKHRFLPVLFFYNPVSRISPLLWAAPSMTDNS